MERSSTASDAVIVTSPTDSRYLPCAVLNSDLAETAQPDSQACLKDLCLEDKCRIAKLIHELARVSEEKDAMMQRLRNDHESFEQKIQQLEEQYQNTVQERESLQKQYHECQELLSLYQQFLSEQRESRSQHELSNSDVPARPLGGARLDCSYWRLSTHEAVMEGGQKMRMAKCTSMPSQPSNPAERGSQVTGLRGARKETQHGWPLIWEGSFPETTASKGVTEQCNCLCSHHMVNCQICQRKDDGGPRLSEVVATVSFVGQENWKEKRYHLLLQKIELEVERERLQARLAQQEERLLQQNQNLHHSYLAYSSDLSSQKDVGVQPGTEWLSMARQPATEILQDKYAMSHPLHACLLSKESSEAVTLSTNDAASSPGVLSTLAAPIPEAPHSCLDSSFIDLLEVMSPISGRDRTRLLTQRHLQHTSNTSKLHSTPALAAFAPVQPTQQSMHEDPEESQLLQEIFFID